MAEVPGSTPGRNTRQQHLGAVDEQEESPGSHPGRCGFESRPRCVALVAQRIERPKTSKWCHGGRVADAPGPGPWCRRPRDREPQPPAGKRVASPSTRGRGFESHPGHRNRSGVAQSAGQRTVNPYRWWFESTRRSPACVAQPGRAPSLQDGCWGFESLRPHSTPKTRGGCLAFVAQRSRAPGSEPGGRWFESSRGHEQAGESATPRTR